MKIISGFFVYKLYITYKAHFNSSADISKYNFKPFKISYSSYIDYKNKKICESLAKKLQYEDVAINFFITAFLINKNYWIGDILFNYHDIKEANEKRLERLHAVSYTFRKDCIYLLEKRLLTFDSNLGNVLIDEYFLSNIALETFIIFKKIFNLRIENNHNYTYIYMERYKKYECLFNINKEKYKNILKEVICSFKKDTKVQEVQEVKSS